MQEGFQHDTPARKAPPEDTDHRRYPFLEWNLLIGEVVDVWRGGLFFRTGLVDETTPSGDTAWIAADGIDHRIMIEKATGYDLWITAEQLLPRRVHQPSDPVAAGGNEAAMWTMPASRPHNTEPLNGESVPPSTPKPPRSVSTKDVTLARVTSKTFPVPNYVFSRGGGGTNIHPKNLI
ncbi:hypothetical protein [Paenarthrobacter sp. 2TAF44]|uniref:hypothetical protein n=1 Tax=Paenarthrobacter sp. 2TAF44 TaxID=3233018 RepID=UPI003F973ACB